MLNFEPIMSQTANQLESGDKYDRSVVHLLSTLEGDAFLVEKKGGAWVVTTGVVGVLPIVEPVVVEEKPKKKKKVIYANQKRWRT